MYLVVQNITLALNREIINCNRVLNLFELMINTFFPKLYQWYFYSSVRKFVIADTDENWYMTKNNKFTVF